MQIDSRKSDIENREAQVSKAVATAKVRYLVLH